MNVIYIEMSFSKKFFLTNLKHMRNYLVRPYCSNMTQNDVTKRIVWVDLEMTGLDIEKDHILEIACLVTNKNLDVIATGPDIVIHQPDDILNSMGEWCTAQHGESISLSDFVRSSEWQTVASWHWHCWEVDKFYHLETGLTEASRKSSISIQEAEKQILDFVSSYVPKSTSPLAGNSVYMDRLFLHKYMPMFNSYLHYRIIDVSTIKELGKRWYPKEYSKIPQKVFKHRCMSDILESIQELKYYKETIFK